MKLRSMALLLVTASSCTLPNPSPRHRVVDDHRSERIERSVKADASLAPAEEPGSVTIVAEPLREVDGISGGRAWLLKLYQDALAAREELARRVETSERERAEAQAAAAALTVERDAATKRCAELDLRVRELESQSLDLARRLAESEIARLESQKAELERESRDDRKEKP